MHKYKLGDIIYILCKVEGLDRKKVPCPMCGGDSKITIRGVLFECVYCNGLDHNYGPVTLAVHTYVIENMRITYHDMHKKKEPYTVEAGTTYSPIILEVLAPKYYSRDRRSNLLKAAYPDSASATKAAKELDVIFAAEHKKDMEIYLTKFKRENNLKE